LFDRFKPFLIKINRTPKEIDCQPKIMEDIEYLVIGIGSIGRPALEHFSQEHQGKVLAIDYNKEKVERLNQKGLQAVWVDTTDREFWEETDLSHIKLVVLSMSDYASNYNTLKQINRLNNRTFKVTVICHYSDEKTNFENLNVDYVYYYKKELGEDFAEHALEVVRGNSEQ
jgi:Trk K+ transport system NAD-binding subunit